MKIIEKKYNRYGEKDYDTHYIDWGIDELDEQLVMAQKIMKLFPQSAKSILDMACGNGRYHKVWLEAGYHVTGVDLSETFIEYAREHNSNYENAEYIISSFDDFACIPNFDFAVLIDGISLTGKAARNIFASLNDGGIFMYELKNENYCKYQNSEKHNENQSWSYKDGVYRLVRHQYNKAASAIEHEEILFDIPNDTMIHKTGFGGKYVNMYSYTQILEAAGFQDVRFIDYDGNLFDPADDQVKRFFVTGKKVD